MRNGIVWFSSPFLELSEASRQLLWRLFPAEKAKSLTVVERFKDRSEYRQFRVWELDQWCFVAFMPNRDPMLKRVSFPFELKCMITFVEEYDTAQHAISHETFYDAEWLFMTVAKAIAIELALPLIVFVISPTTDVIKIETVNTDLTFEPIQRIEDVLTVLQFIDKEER